MPQQLIKLKKADIRAAVAQAALVTAGVDPATPGLVATVRFAETLDVCVGADFSASVMISAPGS